VSDLMLKLFVQLQTLRASEKGQGMVEYALLIAVVSIALVAVFANLETGLQNAVDDIRDALTDAVA
jgi:Flp pilus assembly pilin Flp